MGDIVHLECHLCCKNKFVSLEQSSCRIHKHTVGNAVGQVVHPDLYILSRSCTFNGYVENNTEGFQRELSKLKIKNHETSYEKSLP